MNIVETRGVGALCAFGLGLVIVIAVAVALRHLKNRALAERAERELRETIDALEEEL